MRLSRLHINGFKSFPDRSELGFDTEPTGELFVTFAWKTTLVLAATAVVGLVIARAVNVFA